MATEARIGHGSLVQVGDGGSPEVFTTIAEIRNCSFSFSRNEINVTHMASPEGWDEFISGNKECSISLEGNWIPGHDTQNYAAGILGLWDSGEQRNIRFQIPAEVAGDPPYVWEFQAILIDINFDNPVTEARSFTATMRVTGNPTLV